MSTVTLERTHDLALVKKIVTHPSIYSRCSDDYAPAPEQYEPPSEALYILVRDDHEQPGGIWVLVPQTHTVWAIHTCLLPAMYGMKARIGAQLLLDFVWKSTECIRLVTECVATNRLAIMFAKEAGMTEYGRNPKAYMKHGELRDVVLLGISRPSLPGGVPSHS